MHEPCLVAPNKSSCFGHAEPLLQGWQSSVDVTLLSIYSCSLSIASIKEQDEGVYNNAMNNQFTIAWADKRRSPIASAVEGCMRAWDRTDNMYRISIFHMCRCVKRPYRRDCHTAMPVLDMVWVLLPKWNEAKLRLGKDSDFCWRRHMCLHNRPVSYHDDEYDKIGIDNSRESCLGRCSQDGSACY